MAMRLTGLMSGMDTDSLIQELVAARRTKVDTAVKAQKKLEWKQEAWKELNSKIKGLQSKYLSNMRFTSSYVKRTTKVSNSAAVSVITGEGAVNGVQELRVKDLAKTGYLTGAEIEGANGEKVTASTRISDIDSSFAGGAITVKNGKGETQELAIEADATIADVLVKLKDAGLNASFDEGNQRLFVSAKESGKDSNFYLSGTGGVMTALGLSLSAGATKINGQDAVIELNDAEFTSSTNVFAINGLTITALSETAENETVTITTQDDVDGIYDMIKNFLKEYNSVINELDKLYNAASAKGYEPLLDEEKEAMSETEIEKYEEKIKSALLRRDSDVSTISSALREVMSAGVEIDGKTMYLSNFGIDTLGYFSAPENEKNAYHIAGDPDDESTSGKDDVLKSMIASDPDTVVNFFTKLSQNLYEKMDSMSKGSDGYRTFGSFYDDKKMKSDYDDYTTKIKDLERKLADYEDKWYAKFAAMESAMAKMQSNTSALTSLLGGS